MSSHELFGDRSVLAAGEGWEVTDRPNRFGGHYVWVTNPMGVTREFYSMVTRLAFRGAYRHVRSQSKVRSKWKAKFAALPPFRVTQ